MVKSRDPIIVPNVDREWFTAQLERIGMTYREFATHLPGQPHYSAVIHMFDGVRRMRLDEAVVISVLFGKSLEEIARRAGAMPEPSKPLAKRIDTPRKSRKIS